MLRETKYRIENLSKPLADLDITQSGSWVGVTDFSDANQSVYFENNQIKLPEKVRFPIIRSIDEETVLIVNSRGRNQNNAWIITSSGEVKANFPADDAIEDVVITKDFIVVTQFDEAAIGGDGVCVYDFEGKRLFNYHEVFGKESVDICDCYAAALVKENQIIFCPYTEFPLVLFDIEAKTQQVWETPDIIQGFHAITKFEDKIYFHRVYKLELEGYDFGIYEWQIGSEKAERIGEYSNYFVRGLPEGRFLARTDSGYAIISLQ